ncbi:MAG: squalene/phytoene synthase family protein [candidate division Zixibacteria bacterium]|nr:squalene/phytoene synthase family protein [candidate division Zixibacteria bacterium]
MSKDTPTRLDFAADIDFASILTNPILDIAARVWEPDRYEAFQVCYRSMRRIDDLVDDLKVAHGAVPSDIAGKVRAEIERWLTMTRRRETPDPYQQKFLETIDRFAIPLWPWERLGRAMIYDLHHRGFANFRVFLRYAEGAAISPAAVFMHLCGVRREGDRYLAPRYDIRRAARPLAIFSYLVHIVRDFEKDQRAGLDYFADDIIRQSGLDPALLHELAITGANDERLRPLMRQYHRLTGQYQQWARQSVDRTRPLIEDRYQLSLELIYNLYSQIYERCHPDARAFSGAVLNPPAEEINQRVQQTISTFKPTG